MNGNYMRGNIPFEGEIEECVPDKLLEAVNADHRHLLKIGNLPTSLWDPVFNFCKQNCTHPFDEP
jgi:hypothetical protein